MRSFKKIADSLNIKPLLNALNSHPELWDKNPQRRAYLESPHAEMTDIWVRFGDIADGDFSKLQKEHDSVWYDNSKLLHGVREIAFKLMNLVDGERLGGILITKLPAGGKILPHADSGWHAEYYEKFYVTLTAPKGSLFGFEDGDIISQAGDCYLFRNDRLHWVVNDSNETRLTMIVCIKTDKFKGE